MPLVERIKNEDGILIGYKHIQSDMVKIPIVGIVKDGRVKFDKPKTNLLDDQLDELEKKYGGVNALNNAHIIKDIREARKGTSEYAKQGVIKMYG